MKDKKMNKGLYTILIIIAAIATLIKGGMNLSKVKDDYESMQESAVTGGITVSTYAETAETAQTTETDADTAAPALTTRPDEYVLYHFRHKDRLEEHFEKHGKEMGFSTAEDYERRACDIINDPTSLYKVEAEDGDGVYFVEATNEFVVLSTDGYIRTYYICSGREYFDRQ